MKRGRDAGTRIYIYRIDRRAMQLRHVRATTRNLRYVGVQHVCSALNNGAKNAACAGKSRGERQLFYTVRARKSADAS